MPKLVTWPKDVGTRLHGVDGKEGDFLNEENVGDYFDSDLGIPAVSKPEHN